MGIGSAFSNPTGPLGRDKTRTNLPHQARPDALGRAPVWDRHTRMEGHQTSLDSTGSPR